MSFTIRKGTAADAPAAWRIRREAVMTLCADHYDPDLLDRWTLGEVPPRFPAMMERIYHVAVSDDGEIVGTGAIDLESGKVDGLFVSPNHAGSGIGKALMAHLESLAQGAGLHSMTLESTLNAVAFYRACGFVGEAVENYESPRGFSLDCVPMTKTLGIGKNGNSVNHS